MKKFKRVTFPVAVREEIWRKCCGKVYSHKCYVKWCSNRMTVFDFHVGHNIPLAKGGSNTIENLFPLCARCNLSMSKTTIDDWVKNWAPKKSCCIIL